MGFVANFIRFPAVQKFYRLRFDEVTESLKVVTFLRHSVVSTFKNLMWKVVLCDEITCALNAGVRASINLKLF